MESPLGIPSLNLEDISSDRKNDSPTAMAPPGSRSSFEVLEMFKSPESSPSTESTRKPESPRSPVREIIAVDELPNAEDKPSKSRKKGSRDCSSEKTAKENIIAENERLKKVLSRERRHHAREKNRIRHVLFAIDDALSSLPSRLGKIRVQNQKNLNKINAPEELRDRGDFQTTADGDKCLSEAYGPSYSLSEDVCSVNSTNNKLTKKIKSLNYLIEEMKRGQPAQIEAVLDNELCAISLLKNEIKYTKRKIEQSDRTDSDSVVTNWKEEECLAQRIPDDIETLEKYVCLQKKAISALASEIQKARELVSKEKEQALSDKKALLSEIMKLKSTREKPRPESQKYERLSGQSREGPAVSRPFRVIKELKCQLEEKEKVLTSWKAKSSRLESAAANKGTLLENEKKKCSELEGKVKLLSTENQSYLVQLQSLKVINAEMKDQMEVLKKQIEVLIKQNSEIPAANPCDLKNHFAELTEMLKSEDARLKSVQEEAEKKLREIEEKCVRDVDFVRTLFEKSEKINFEYLRTLKSLLFSMHNHRLQKLTKLKSKITCERAKEILGITENELENFFSGNLKEANQKELEDLYDQCCSIVNGKEDSEFSIRLSAWLFEVAKQKMTDQNSHGSID